MEEVAGRVVRYLYENFGTGAGQEKAFALVRLFKTHPAGKLDPETRVLAEALAREPMSPATSCLTLLATAGDQPAWNERRSSVSHRAIPLTSEAMVAQAPMVSRLFEELGIPVRAVIDPAAGVSFDVQHQSFSVFHVEQAFGSPWIPAQKDFVEPFGIRSVLGFGGALATGAFFAVLIFSRHRIGATVAELFGSLALNVKVAIQPFGDDEVFAADG